MSYYGPTEGLYRAIAAAEHEDRVRRILALDVRYGSCAETSADVGATYDPSTCSTALEQPCAWCGRSVSVEVTDLELVVAQSTHDVAATALDRACADHLAARGCATSGHDPGDEDPGEDAARRAWRPTP